MNFHNSTNRCYKVPYPYHLQLIVVSELSEFEKKVLPRSKPKSAVGNKLQITKRRYKLELLLSAKVVKLAGFASIIRISANVIITCVWYVIVNTNNELCTNLHPSPSLIDMEGNK